MFTEKMESSKFYNCRVSHRLLPRSAFASLHFFMRRSKLYKKLKEIVLSLQNGIKVSLLSVIELHSRVLSGRYVNTRKDLTIVSKCSLFCSAFCLIQYTYEVFPILILRNCLTRTSFLNKNILVSTSCIPINP